MYVCLVRVGAHVLIVQALMFLAHGIKGGTECSGPGSNAMFADRFESSSSRGAVYAIASVRCTPSVAVRALGTVHNLRVNAVAGVSIGV